MGDVHQMFYLMDISLSCYALPLQQILLASPVIISPLAVLGFLNRGETHERQEI